MLVIGGIGSLWGAVVGAVVVSTLNSFLAEAERGMNLLGVEFQVPGSTRLVAMGVLMLAMLALRPTGLTENRELAWPFFHRPAKASVADGTAGPDAPG
jgi:branched-chain amino acid transport system permease protein